ncbi:MAG TPA: hypothetical protein VIC57_05790 [Candidatus Dormibacteraeota bacterium]|jgi:hypothetical protein
MNADDDGGPDFAPLERELQRRLATLRGPSPMVRQAAYRAVATGGRAPMPIASSLVAASIKAAAGVATAALVVGGGTAAAAAAATHSTNPATWGQTVTDAVASCKSQLGEGEHGIGQCVSAVAKKHGQAQRAAESQAGDHGQPGATPSPHPTGNGNGHSGNGETDHPGGKPTSVPTAHPHPTGPPVTPPTPSPRHQ